MMGRGFGVGWRQVGSAFMLLCATSFIASSYSIVAVPLGREFHPPRTVLMLAMTIMAAVSALLSSFLGNLMDRASLRRMMIAGALLLAAGYAAISFATSFGQVLAIFGLLIAPANVLIGPVAATVLISRWFVARRGTAIGIAIAGIAMGSVIWPPILQGLLSHLEWRIAFRIFAAILLTWTLPAAIAVVNNPADRGMHPDGATAEVAARADRDRAPAVSVAAILGDPAFWIGVAIFSIVLSGVKGVVTNLAPMAIDNGVTATSAAYLLSIYGMIGFVSKLSFAAIADRFSIRTLLFASLAGFAGGMACLTQAAAGFGIIAGGVVLIGFSSGLMLPLQSYLVPQIFGQRVVGRAMGLMSMVMLVFLLTTPPLFGGIYDLTGSYAAIFATFIALAALVAVLVPYLRLHPREQPAPIGEVLAETGGATA